MAVQVFVCHNHHDHRYLEDGSLLGYLKGLENDGIATFWHDAQIVTGDLWDDEIKARISNSAIALILVSQWLLNSKYVMNEEVPKFFKKRKEEGMVIFPVILSACEWQRHDWLSKTSFLPKKGNIESDYCELGRQKELFLEILRDLRIQIERITKKSTSNYSGTDKSRLATVVPNSTAAAATKRTEILRGEPKKMWGNPFSLVTANDMKPEEISALFVGDYTNFETIKKHFDTMLEGQRGTGKTMVLRYLGFGTQLEEWVEREKRPAAEFFEKPNCFVGLYCRLEQGVFDKTENNAIASNERKERLFEHRLCLYCLACADGILDAIDAILKVRPIQPRELRRLNANLAVLLQEPKIADCTDWDETIVYAKDTINLRVVEEDMHIGSVSPGGTPTTFNPYLTMSGQIVSFLELIKNMFGLPCPFFLMLDDFDVLTSSQQMCVFRTASARKLGTVCFKYGVMSLGRKTNLAGTARTYREGDDYDLVLLDWTDKGLQRNYRKAAEIIVAKRLETKKWPVQDFPALLPAWEHGIKIREEVKNEMLAEWKDLPPGMRPKTPENYWTKYGDARYFQKLSGLKTYHRYSGFAEIVDISSGIYRQLLEICAKIVDKTLASGWSPDAPATVSAEIQDDAIREYSDAMLDTLSQTAGDTTALLSGDVSITSKHMVTLIESLSDLFYFRLHSKSREPEIFCVAIKDELGLHPFAKSILDVAVRESILQRRSTDYTPKTPGGPPLPTYMLNRRLAPRRNLGIRMQGRIEILSSHIELATTDRKSFIRQFGKVKVRYPRQAGPRLFPAE